MKKITDDMLTGWFPAHIEPFHVGYYDVRWFLLTGLIGEKKLMWWDGKGFKDSPNDDSWYYWFSSTTGDKWRGLKEPMTGM